MPDTLESHDIQAFLTSPGVMEALFSPKPGEEHVEPEPKPEPNPRFTEDDYALYCAARKVADLVFEEWVKCGGTIDGGIPNPWIGDRRYERVNAFYSQTTTGLRLEWSYSLPRCIHTPWGQWSITGGASYSGDIMERFEAAVKARLGLETYVKLYIAHGPLGGPIGPVYNVTAIDGAPLPAATSDSAHTSWRSYEDSHAQWAALIARYEAEHPGKKYISERVRRERREQARKAPARRPTRIAKRIAARAGAYHFPK